MKSSQYVTLFVDEAGQLLEQCHHCLEKLEQAPERVDASRELFRLIHTLKGMAASLIDQPHFEDITQLSHTIESLLGECQPPISAHDLQNLTEAIQVLGLLLQNITHPHQKSNLQTELQRIYSKFESPTFPLLQASTSGINGEMQLNTLQQEQLARFRTAGKAIFEVQVQLMQACLMKSVRALLVLHNLEQQAEVIETAPDMNFLREGVFDNAFEVLLATECSAAEIQAVAESVSEIQDVVVRPYPSLAPPPAVPDSLNEFELRLLEEAQRQALNALWIKVYLMDPDSTVTAQITQLFRQLELQGEIIKTQPSVQALETGLIDETFLLLLVTPTDIHSLKDHLENQRVFQSCFQFEVFSQSNASTQAEPARKVLSLTASHDLNLHIATANGEARTQIPLSEQAQGLLSSSERLKSIRMNHLVRVDASQLKELSHLTGELLLAKARLLKMESQTASLEGFGELSQLIAALQSVSMQLQTITASQVFYRYPRMVRDLARSLGKDIQCILQGEEVEIDRAYVDDLSSILLHMIRNAADHGLESTLERQESGKPPQGKIQLRARQQDQQLIIEVQDDGQGIDIEAIKTKAVQRDLLTQEAAQQLSETEALQLMFRPGLSTSATTTDISGRGVGMDVILTHVHQLGGQLQVESEAGHGTRFTITLPSELRHIQAVLVKAQNQYFALPLNQVQRICLPHESFLSANTPLISLRSLDRIQYSIPPQTEPCIMVKVSSSTEGKSIWLLADELMGYQEITVKSLNDHSEYPHLIQGAAMLSPESLALYIEPQKIRSLL